MRPDTQYGRLDSPPVRDGDPGFRGVNMRDHPALLQPGEVASARNARFTANDSAPRLGLAILPHANRVHTGIGDAQPFTTLHGGEVFRDPNGLEWTIIAADGQCWRHREGSVYQQVPLPAGVTLSGSVTFTQTFNGFIMFRGEDLAALYLTDIDAGFQSITQGENTIAGEDTENPSDGTFPIPNAENGDWIGNRLFIPTGDFLEISDYLNATRYAGVRAQARINEGSSDRLVRFFRFSDNTGIAFKSQSIYVLQGIVGSLEGMTQYELTREYGLAAAATCINTGADVWFLAEKRGICSIRLTEQNKLQGVDVPISAEIQSLVDRINWTLAGRACAAFHDNKAYFSVPLDDGRNMGANCILNTAAYSGGGSYTLYLLPGRKYQWTKGASDTSLVNGADTLTVTGEFTVSATGTGVVTLNGTAGASLTATVQLIYENVNNAVLVFDFLKQKWAGYDTGGGMMVLGFIKAPYQGARRLYALCSDGFVKLVEELFYDEVGGHFLLPEITPGGGFPPVYDGAGIYTLNSLTVGLSYYWVKGATHDNQLLNGGTQVLNESGFFTCLGTVLLYGTAPGVTVESTVLSVQWITGIEWIDHDVTYRGWPCGSEMMKRFLSGELQISTWFPSYTVSLLTDGANESLDEADSAQTKDRTRYYQPAFKADYDASNVNDDHATGWREDYSVVMGDSTTASGGIEAGLLYYVEDLTGAASISYNGVPYNAPATFTGVAGVTTFTVLSGSPLVYGPGNYVFLGNNGIDFDLHQQTTEELNFRNHGLRGRYCQLRVRSTRGRVRVLAANIEGNLLNQNSGSHA